MSRALTDRRILIVDDELSIRKALEQRLSEDGVVTDAAGNVTSARQKIEANEYDLVVLDNRLPDGTGVALLSALRKEGFATPVIIMTAYSTTQEAVKAMKVGASDYVIKPFDLDEMMVVIEKALEHDALQGEVTRLRARDRAAACVDNLIGGSRAMQELRDFVQRVAGSGAQTILISGESGTGKDLVARAIHYSSPEQDRPFLNITCTALPETLLETELFGHEKGAFTDARQAKKGLFEAADGGTIFLDEIGDMPLSLQAKLLRFLESKAFRRVGGLREIHVNVRVVAATNRNLMQAMESGQFRSDLYYRLNVIPIEISPLRDRLEDVPDLLDHFVRHFARELRKDVAGFDAESTKILSTYPWPGNVRELRNCVERAVLLCRVPQLSTGDLPREVLKCSVSSAAAGGRLLGLPESGIVLDDLIKDLLDQSLQMSKGNKSKAATLLGIHRDQVRYWVKKYELTQWIRTRSAVPAGAAEGDDEED